MQQSRGSAAVVATIVILAVVTLAAIGAAFYFWQKSENIETNVVATMTAVPAMTTIATPTSTVVKTSTPTTTVAPTTTPAVAEPDQTPTKVVETFMNATLGTLPNAKIDYTLARTYMTDALKAQYSGETWVPQFYGIQDGPISVKFISQNVVGDEAFVRFDPSWGEMSLGWSFTLEKTSNTWLISGFQNDAQ